MNKGCDVKRPVMISRQNLSIFLVEDHGGLLILRPPMWHLLNKVSLYEIVSSMIALVSGKR